MKVGSWLNRAMLFSHVMSGLALCAEVLAQTRPDASDRFGTDPIDHGLDWVRVGFFHVVPRVVNLTQPMCPSIGVHAVAILRCCGYNDFLVLSSAASFPSLKLLMFSPSLF